MRFKPYSPDQRDLFGYRPDDVLRDDDPACLVAEVVSQMDLGALKWQGEGAGQDDPALRLPAHKCRMSNSNSRVIIENYDANRKKILNN